MEKKGNKCLKGIIIVLLLLLFGMGGYIIHDLVNSENKNSNTENNIKNDSETKDVVDTNCKEDNYFSQFIGKYVYEKTTKAESVDKVSDGESSIIAELEIYSDGTATFRGGNVFGDVETAKGNIAINAKKIYLLNDNCKNTAVVGSECSYPNCHPIIEFSYENNQIVWNNQASNEKIILTKQK